MLFRMASWAVSSPVAWVTVPKSRVKAVRSAQGPIAAAERDVRLRKVVDLPRETHRPGARARSGRSEFRVAKFTVAAREQPALAVLSPTFRLVLSTRPALVPAACPRS